jgi:hypothetical protein
MRSFDAYAYIFKNCPLFISYLLPVLCCDLALKKPPEGGSHFLMDFQKMQTN